MHNTTNSQLLKHLQRHSDKKDSKNTNLSKNDNNTVSFTISNGDDTQHMNRVCMVIFLSIIVDNVVAIYCTVNHIHTNHCIFILSTSIFNGTFKHMREKLYNHNHAIKRSCFYTTKMITSYNVKLQQYTCL